ncbi:MlaD family protein [Streptomyces sp. NPDC005202]|uniref:MlaD family protein n=1 Tax=Streptomyces sp. NPDC005202 TaxID=3157021 RepID=UPI0033B900DC
MFGRNEAGGRRKFSPAKIGVLMAVVTLAIGAALFNKDRIATTLSAGDVLRINFPEDYKLREDVTEVKVAGVPVGRVSSVDRNGDGTAMVEVKIDDGVREKLGKSPSAEVRPVTLLGGKYYVELVPGGDKGSPDGTIPVQRTKVPVELDKVTRALQPSALDGARSSIAQLDKTLGNGGSTAIDELLADAPPALVPAGQVLTAAQGTNPRTDLTNLVHGLESTSRVLTEQDGQLDSIVRNLSSTSSVLGNRARDISGTLQTLPDALHSAKSGLSRLDTTLGKLKNTADSARPVARELNTTLKHADPVLVKAKPFVSNVRKLLVDTRPLVQDLVPASRQATEVMNGLNGPVLDRINGPITKFTLSPWNGTGNYTGSGSNKPFYKEVGFLAANMVREAVVSDRNGHVIMAHAGVGPGSVGGLPISFEQLVSQLIQMPVQKSEGGPR